MSSEVPSLSSASAVTPKIPAEGRVSRAEAQVPQIVPDEDEPLPTLTQLLLGATATSYYLSLLLHLVAYVVAAIAFVLLGNHLLEQDTIITPIRASLDDFDRNADQPQFETVAEIDLSPSQSESSIQRISNNLRVVQNGLISVRPNELLPSTASTDSDGAGGGAEEFLFKIPESGLAVTKGSFTVWTSPEVPRVREPYRIIIELRLTDKIKAYRINDLSGRVIGSDRYEQNIPFDAKAPNSLFYTDENLKEVPVRNGSESITVRDNKIQLVIRVPGADRLVKDTIQIRSRRLRERQELELVFGGR